MIQVLYVADDQNRVAEATAALEADGRFDAVSVRTAAAALDRLGTQSVDCLLSASELPHSDGLDFCSQVREQYPELPVLLFPVSSSDDVVEAAIDAGVTDCVLKSPAQERVLANRIANAVDAVRARQDAASAQREMQRTHRRLDDALVGIDDDWQYTYLNEAAEQLLGRSETALVGQQVWEAVPEITGTRFESGLREAMETQQSLTVTDWYPPQQKQLKARICPSDDGLSVYFREATPEESERQFLAQIVDEVGVGIAVYTENAQFVRINEAYADLLDIKKRRLEGMYVWEVNPALDKARFESYWDSFGEGETRIAETEHLRLDGTAVPVETVTTCRTIGNRTYHFGTIRDVTERKERENELQQQNEYLDEFASIVSHDLRNPLNAAQLYLDLVADETDSEYVTGIESSLDRMERIVEETLELARSGRTIGEKEPVPLELLVTECWQTIATSDATLETVDSGRVYADPERFRHLIENLLQNAIAHGGSDVHISVGTTDDGFYVADDGAGLPDVPESALFDSSFSDSEDGTGLGLVIVDRIAQAHDWEVSAGESETGGARFDIQGSLVRENTERE